jgi:putative ABC transport system substrate-binding protein
MAREVIKLKPDAIFVTSTRLLFVFKQATTTIPIVGVTADPVRLGLVASLARPGGNITGVAHDPGIEFYNKRFELLKEAVPKVAKLGLLLSRPLVEKSPAGASTRDAAKRAGIELVWPIEALYWGDESIDPHLSAWHEKALMGSSCLNRTKTGPTGD